MGFVHSLPEAFFTKSGLSGNYLNIKRDWFMKKPFEKLNKIKLHQSKFINQVCELFLIL